MFADFSYLRRQVLLLMMLPISLGCDSSIRNGGKTIGNVFCDGNTVSLIYEDRVSVTGNSWRKHSGGYIISSDEYAWSIRWSIHDMMTRRDSSNPTTAFLGHFSQRLDRADPNFHSIEKGLIAVGYISTGSQSCTIHSLLDGDRFRVVEGGHVLSPLNMVIPDPKVPRGLILDRPRQHVYALLPKPAIYSLPDLKLVRQISQSENAKIHNQFLRDNANTVVLTEDLSNLIAISAPTVVDGKRTTKALCYNFERDENVEVRIPCEEGMLVSDAEATSDGIYWAVGGNNDGEVSWRLLDPQLSMKTKINFPAWVLRTNYDEFWIPTQNALWMVEYMPLQIKSPIVLHKYDLGDGSHTQAVLTLPELTKPEAN